MLVPPSLLSVVAAVALLTGTAGGARAQGDERAAAEDRPGSTSERSAPVEVQEALEGEAADENDFERRLASLTEKLKPFEVEMAPDEDPGPVAQRDEVEGPVPFAGRAPSGPVLISGTRLGIFTPAVLSSEDVQLVVRQHMSDIRTCYKKQLRRDPDWSDSLILDLAIKRSGRVSEVSVAPRRVRRALIGRCIMRSVPRWRFPRFTGEMGDGITQEVVNASFPFRFHPR